MPESDFARRLGDGLESVQADKEAQKKTEEEKKAVAEQELRKEEEASAAVDRLVQRFVPRHIERLIKEIQKQIPGGVSKENRDEGDHGWMYSFGEEALHLSIGTRFHQIGLRAEARSGNEWYRKAKEYPDTAFDEQVAAQWMEEQAIEAAKHFLRHTKQANVQIVRYGQDEA
jgi:hypothetical protein